MLDAASGSLRHRGPDDQGRFVGPGVGLVHTRLSLVDPNPRSGQPFRDASGRYVLIYNGEIYNFRELRAELEREGATFRTTSDTEVLLELLIRRGPRDALAALDGMFAFVLYDTLADSLVVGRDLLGIKPLFTCERDGAFYFASELQALRVLGSLEPSEIAVASYVSDYGVPTRGGTMFRGVSIVDPGSFVTLTRNTPPQVETFRRLQDLHDPELAARLAQSKPRELVDAFDERMTAAVSRQLFADAPVGAFCSGGVDSSLVVGVGARIRPDLAIFHADVVGDCSEKHVASDLAKHLGLELRSVAVEPQHFVDLIPRVVHHYGYPFSGHPNSIPFLMVSECVRSHGVKGVLSGEGSDELFLGYPKYLPTVGAALARLPDATLRRMRIRRGRAKPLRARKLASHDVMRALFHRLGNEEEIDSIERLVKDKREGEIDPRNLLSLKALSHHLRTLLHRNDCLGMAASVESRFPFLDTDLVRFAINLPYEAKARLGASTIDPRHPFVVDKWIVRQLAERYLPASFARRPKQGFTVRVHKSMRIAKRLFRGGFAQSLFELTDDRLDLLLDSAPQDLKVRLLQLDVWAALFFAGESPEVISERLRRHVTAEE